MTARMVEVTLVNHTQYPIRWKDDGRPHGFWQEPWLPSHIVDLKKGELAKFRLESGGIMTGVEGWVEFIIDVPPTNEGNPRTEFLRLWFERPYIGHFDRKIEHSLSPRPHGYDSWPVHVFTQESYASEIANQGGETFWEVIPAAAAWPLTPLIFILNQSAGLHPGWKVGIYEISASSIPLISSEPQFIGTFPVSEVQVDSSILYGITTAGNLLWYRHDGSSNDLGIDVAGSWLGPSTVGTGWQNFKQVFVGDGNVIYGISYDGSLKWYRHDGFNNGLGLTKDGSLAPKAWADDSGKTVGRGWANFKHVFSGGKGVIYAVSELGELIWYRHNGSRNGMSLEDAGSWVGPIKVGTEWDNFKHIFSEGDGIIYAITPDGILKWYKHIGFENGEPIWEGPVEVGNGWNNFSKVFSSGIRVTGDPALNGVIIYAITESTLLFSRIKESHSSNFRRPGKLLWYKHRGYKNGTKDWDGAKTVGSGWENFEKIVALLPGIVDVIR